MSPTIGPDPSELDRLRIETERIEVTTNRPTVDKKWRHTDQQGHEHYWRNGYPTLRTIVDEVIFTEDGDEIEIMHFECVTCGETIEPGSRRPSAFREYVPGRTSYYLDDEPITQERALEIINRARTQKGES